MIQHRQLETQLEHPPSARPTQRHDRPKIEYSGFSISVKSENNLLYWGLLGRIGIRKHSKVIRSPQSMRPDTTGFLNDECVISIIPSFSRYGFDIRYSTKSGPILKSLTFYQIIPYRNPILALVRYGTLDALQAAFSNGNTSPYVVDQSGKTLLYVRFPCRARQEVYEFAKKRFSMPPWLIVQI